MWTVRLISLILWALAPAMLLPGIVADTGLEAKALKLAAVGELEEALAKFKKALKVDPSDGRVRENLAVTQMRLLKLKDAKKSFSKCERDGHEPSPKNLAALKALKADPEGAETAGEYVSPAKKKPPAAAAKKGAAKKAKAPKKAKAVTVGSDGDEEELPDEEYPVADNEEILWKFGDPEPPNIEGMKILLPEMISRISKFTIDHGDTTGTCGYKDFIVIRDRRNELISSAVDNFFSPAIVAKLRDMAINHTKHKLEWSWADIHPNMQKHLAKDKRKGISFPGLRLHVSSLATPNVVKCLKPVMAIVAPDFNLKKVKDSQTLFGNIVPHEGLKDKDGDIKWLDSERIPHTDIRWDHGTLPNNRVPMSFASVLPLTTDFNNSGTSLWREMATKLNVLRTVAENEEAQGNMNPHVANRRHADLNLLEEIPAPFPFDTVKHPWAEAIMVPLLRFNRFAFYDGRHLHNYYVEAADFPRLSKDPKIGRLTMNSFFWGKGSN
jgi:hypothetical protein